VAREDLDSSLIVPLIKRAEPEAQAAHLRQVTNWALDGGT
jgi:hypothetical protein